MTRLFLQDATRSFDRNLCLGPVDLNLNLKGLTVILGPNGAGKSLFLALCHGTMPPCSGKVLWDGKEAQYTRGHRGYMLQTPVVLRRTVAANLDFALHSNGTPKRARTDKIEAALTRVRLTDRANAPAATLSGGELRRMNLARALVTEPEVLLLDEPFAGLDPASTHAMETIITDTAKTLPVLMSNHDLSQTRRISDHILFFSDGALVESSVASDFFLSPQSPKSQSFLKGQFL